MKRIISCCLGAAMALFCAGVLSAQNRSIEFAPETDTMEEMFAKAAAQGKIVFMDCYTSWCGPCKMMARDIFTTDRVADFFNANFYCAKYDMEKGEGLKINKKYGVSAYPTFLFIDPKTGFLVHTLVGGRPADDFIAGAREALNPDLSMEKARAAYESGEKTPETVNNYLTVLGKAHLGGPMNEVAADYLKGMTKEQLAEMDNWGIFMRGVSDLYSEPMQTVFKNRDFFNKAIGEREVSSKTGNVLYMYARDFVHSKAVGPDEAWDQAAFDEAEAYIRKCGDPSAAELLLQMKATEANQNEDYATVLKCLKKDLKNDVVRGNNKLFFTASNVARLIQIKSKSLKKKACKYFEKAFNAAESDLDKANARRMEGIVREQWGDADGSKKAMDESMEYARKNAESRKQQ